MERKERAAALLREAVGRAVKEWENSQHRELVTQAGTWKQSSWGSVETDTLGQWESLTLNRLSLLVAPQGETLACGTTGCVAGHMAVADGWRFALVANYVDRENRENEVSTALKGDRYESISTIGFEIMAPLGDPRQVTCPDDRSYGHDLFNGGNSITDVVLIADQMLRNNNLPTTGCSMLGLPESRLTCLMTKEG